MPNGQLLTVKVLGFNYWQLPSIRHFPSFKQLHGRGIKVVFIEFTSVFDSMADWHLRKFNNKLILKTFIKKDF